MSSLVGRGASHRQPRGRTLAWGPCLRRTNELKGDHQGTRTRSNDVAATHMARWQAGDMSGAGRRGKTVGREAERTDKLDHEGNQQSKHQTPDELRREQRVHERAESEGCGWRQGRASRGNDLPLDSKRGRSRARSAGSASVRCSMQSLQTTTRSLERACISCCS